MVFVAFTQEPSVAGRIFLHLRITTAVCQFLGGTFSADAGSLVVDLETVNDVAGEAPPPSVLAKKSSSICLEVVSIISAVCFQVGGQCSVLDEAIVASVLVHKHGIPLRSIKVGGFYERKGGFRTLDIDAKVAVDSVGSVVRNIVQICQSRQCSDGLSGIDGLSFTSAAGSTVHGVAIGYLKVLLGTVSQHRGIYGIEFHEGNGLRVSILPRVHLSGSCMIEMTDRTRGKEECSFCGCGCVSTQSDTSGMNFQRCFGSVGCQRFCTAARLRPAGEFVDSGDRIGAIVLFFHIPEISSLSDVISHWGSGSLGEVLSHSFFGRLNPTVGLVGVHLFQHVVTAGEVCQIRYFGGRNGSHTVIIISVSHGQGNDSIFAIFAGVGIPTCERAGIAVPINAGSGSSHQPVSGRAVLGNAYLVAVGSRNHIRVTTLTCHRNVTTGAGAERELAFIFSVCLEDVVVGSIHCGSNAWSI